MSGNTFCALLTLLFIGLKLGGVIAWPWLAVISPLLIAIVVTFIILVLLEVL